MILTSEALHIVLKNWPNIMSWPQKNWVTEKEKKTYVLMAGVDKNSLDTSFKKQNE